MRCVDVPVIVGPNCSRGRIVLAGLLTLSAWCAAGSLRAEEAQWIRSPAYEKEMAPAGECYFRKTFVLGWPESGEIQIGCDYRYGLYVNGRHIGSGSNWKLLDVYDITPAPGRRQKHCRCKRVPTATRGPPGWWPGVLVKPARRGRKSRIRLMEPGKPRSRNLSVGGKTAV